LRLPQHCAAAAEWARPVSSGIDLSIAFSCRSPLTGPTTSTHGGGTTYRFNAFGAGHIVGTYRMESQKTDSVVDSHQRTWDHPTLFLLGSGTFPTIATSNPTLTIAALTYRTPEKILGDLGP
jgi:choline dehydrogenase-like flavoprotein